MPKMEPAGEFPSYAAILEKIGDTCAHNYDLLIFVYKYTSNFKKALETLKNTTDELTYDKLASQFPKIPDALTTVINSNFTEALRNLMEMGFKPVAAFEVAISSFDNFSYTIKGMAEEYDSRRKQILEKGEKTLQTLVDATDAAACAHAHYVQAGEALKAGFAQKSSKLAELKTAFQTAQKNAVDIHNRMNNIRGLVTTEFGEVLTDFEMTESWRLENWAAALTSFSASLNEAAGLLFSMNNVITRLVGEADDELDRLLDTEFLKNAAASPRYQLVTVPGIASKWIDMTTCFKDDIKAGGKLYCVIQDFKGNHEQLDVKKGEVIICLESRNEQAFCKDINEAKGLLPYSVIEAME